MNIMPAEIPTNNPEKREAIADNDRKFIVGTIDPEFLAEHGSKSYYLITDWLETNEDDETKLARKIFENGKVQLLHIAKVMVGGDREAVKKEITEEKYLELLDPELPHVEKTRYEFTLFQNGTEFKVKYDVFTDSILRILEIDAENADKRKLFEPSEFPYLLEEVTADERYRGYRVAKMV